MTVIRQLRITSMRSRIREEEKGRINRSVNHIKLQLRRYFKSDIRDIVVFGSYSRDTLLSRKLDERSDVDLMVLFKDNNFQPQTYLDRLRKFSETTYKRSQIYQSNPTIVIQLNHINFELVPAIKTWFNGLQIPAPAKNFESWMETNPVSFKEELQEKNSRTGSNMKPLIRLVKYWNANSGYVFPSYELEQKIVSFWYWGNSNLRDYFYEAISNLSLGWGAASWKQERLEQVKERIALAQQYEKNKQIEYAIREITKVLPPFWG